jgi:hypothetical protein
MFGGDVPPADRAAVAASASTFAHAVSPSLTRLIFIAIRNVAGRGDRSRRIGFILSKERSKLASGWLSFGSGWNDHGQRNAA